MVNESLKKGGHPRGCEGFQVVLLMNELDPKKKKKKKIVYHPYHHVWSGDGAVSRHDLSSSSTEMQAGLHE